MRAQDRVTQMRRQQHEILGLIVIEEGLMHIYESNRSVMEIRWPFPSQVIADCLSLLELFFPWSS